MVNRWINIIKLILLKILSDYALNNLDIKFQLISVYIKQTDKKKAVIWNEIVKSN